MDSLVATFRESVIDASEKNSHGLNKDIQIEHFIESFDKLLPIIQALGFAFKFVVKDITSKLKIIKENKESSGSNFLFDLMYDEYRSNKAKDKRSTCRNSLRLKRALHFIEIFLEKLNNKNQDLREAARDAYAISLSPYHKVSVRSAVSIAFYTLPSRDDFLKSVDLDPNTESLFDNLVHAINGLRNVMDEFFEKFDLINV